jgi:hypothetical protein
MNFKTFEPTTTRTEYGKTPKVSMYLSNNQFRFNKYAVMALKMTSKSRCRFHYDNDKKVWFLEVGTTGYKVHLSQYAPFVQSKAVVKAMQEMYNFSDKTVYFTFEMPKMQTDTGIFYQITFLN